MEIFAQHKNCPCQVLFAFDEVAQPTVEQVRWAVAYATLKGCERLVSRIADRMGPIRWKRIPKYFVISLDFGLTEPAALQFLADQSHSRVRIANSEVVGKAGFRPTQAYHPKLYLFDRRGKTGFVVGSANLTGGALISNTEVVSTGFETPTTGGWNDSWNGLLDGTRPLTTALLGKYRKKRSGPGLLEAEPDPGPAPPIIRASDQPVFWDAIRSGKVSPSAFTHLWIESDPGHPLELPRGADRFFGHHTPKALPCRPDSRHHAVLIRRRGPDFEISLFPWDDEVTITWRVASKALGTLYRLNEAGPLICGLF